MKIALLLLLIPNLLLAQQLLEPPVDLPATLAKVPEFSDFEGIWLRADGTYRLEIDGTAPPFDSLAVQYFNPSPIHVESAKFAPNAESPELTIVLRDEGYPGSTYRLQYFAQRAVLLGTYSRPDQAPMEVYFVKQSP